ncbi:unnamed protein product [Euphydryas editha]|uniref:BRCT domain-containing protein n=1 Tax=Euphydryas editha TaxID=104508 RepID=A0AAU9TEL2_EUPED|nr:unnamed protein product [Euphydryas editha]
MAVLLYNCQFLSLLLFLCSECCVQCANLWIAGLYDSVTPEELAGVIAKAGGCALEAVKVGEIRQNYTSIGTPWVPCPVEAAKNVVERRRLLVGFVSAGVGLLKERPHQCYRCHEVGHVAFISLMPGIYLFKSVIHNKY